MLQGYTLIKIWLLNTEQTGDYLLSVLERHIKEFLQLVIISKPHDSWHFPYMEKIKSASSYRYNFIRVAIVMAMSSSLHPVLLNFVQGVSKSIKKSPL